MEKLLSEVAEYYNMFDVNTIDGVKIDFPDKWIHLRKSNTEPIIRIYAEAQTMQEADALIAEMHLLVKAKIGN